MNIPVTSVFVSYSHSDAPLVAPVVALLRASNLVVFRDADTIQPGKRWRSEIEKAIREAQLVVVFCCRHSTASYEVTYEYQPFQGLCARPCMSTRAVET